jgi:hypothetical protein
MHIRCKNTKRLYKYQFVMTVKLPSNLWYAILETSDIERKTFLKSQERALLEGIGYCAYLVFQGDFLPKNYWTFLLFLAPYWKGTNPTYFNTSISNFKKRVGGFWRHRDIVHEIHERHEIF